MLRYSAFSKSKSIDVLKGEDAGFGCSLEDTLRCGKLLQVSVVCILGLPQPSLFILTLATQESMLDHVAEFLRFRCDSELKFGNARFRVDTRWLTS